MSNKNIFICLILIFLLPSPAFAYIDPGTGGVIVTTILGFIAAISYSLRKYFYQFKRLITRNKKENKKN